MKDVYCTSITFQKYKNLYYLCTMKTSKFYILIPLLVLVFAFSLREVVPKTSAKLGEKLFFDPVLSEDMRISCASCHIPSFAFSDTTQFSKGVHNKRGTRNAPSLTDLEFREHFFLDGRVNTLEEQITHPITNPFEMNLAISELLIRLKKSKDYVKSFQKVFKSDITEALLVKALSDYIRTLESSESAFDGFMKKGKNPLFSASAERGRALFIGKAKCFDCHFGPDFTGDEFRNIGLYNNIEYKDLGRYNVTKKNEDKGKFRVAPLRNIAVTAPYMHDGSFKTLQDVLKYYNNPDKFVANSIGRDALLNSPLNLNASEIDDLESFLISLTDKKYYK